jgi:hypothetical protein
MSTDKPAAPRLRKADFYILSASEASDSEAESEPTSEKDDEDPLAVKIGDEKKPKAPKVRKRKKKAKEEDSEKDDADESDLSDLIATDHEEIDEERERRARAELDRQREIEEEKDFRAKMREMEHFDEQLREIDEIMNESEQSASPQPPPPPEEPEPILPEQKKRMLLEEPAPPAPPHEAAAKPIAPQKQDAAPPRMLAPKKHKAAAAAEAAEEEAAAAEPPPHMEGEIVEDLPENSLQELKYHPHFHICLWYSKIAVTDRKGENAEHFIDFNLLQHRLLRHFPDVLVSQVRQQSRLYEIIGAERYWLIASDCTLVTDLLTATNAQTDAFQFRIAWENLFAHKVKSLRYWEQQYDHYLWTLRTNVCARKGFKSLSDRYDRAQELTDKNALALVQLPGGYSDRTSFNLKLRSFLFEHNFKLRRTPQGEWQAFKLIEGMNFSYKLACPTLEHLKALLIGTSEGWNNEVTKYANGNWNTEFGAQALGNFPLLVRDWHWVEFASDQYGFGGGWFYIVDDPNRECENTERRRALMRMYCKEEHQKAQGNFYRNLPEWWPLPGHTTVYMRDGRVITRDYENGFLYRNSLYRCPITKREWNMVEFVEDKLAGKTCGFYDTRPARLVHLDQPDSEEGDARWTGPRNWLSLLEPYKCEPCPRHEWERRSDNPLYWRCRTMIGNRPCSMKKVMGRGANGEEPPRERHRLSALGPEFWICDLMDIFRGAIETEHWYRKRSLMIYGESSLGKSTVMAPFTDNEGCLFPRDAFFVAGDGTKADILAGLAEDAEIKIAVFEDFDPKKSFPDVALLKVFLDGGKIGARQMRKNTTRVSANFPKFFNANPHMSMGTVTFFGKEVRRLIPTEGHMANKKDAGNPFGPHYDPDNALSNRCSVVRWNIDNTGEEMDTLLRDRVIHESIDILVYLARLRYVPLKRRSTWLQARKYRRNERDGVDD